MARNANLCSFIPFCIRSSSCFYACQDHNHIIGTLVKSRSELCKATTVHPQHTSVHRPTVPRAYRPFGGFRHEKVWRGMDQLGSALVASLSLPRQHAYRPLCTSLQIFSEIFEATSSNAHRQEGTPSVESLLMCTMEPSSGRPGLAASAQ